MIRRLKVKIRWLKLNENDWVYKIKVFVGLLGSPSLKMMIEADEAQYRIAKFYEGLGIFQKGEKDR